jgi:hypothetical protein
MKYTLSQEAYLEEEFKLLGVKPHIVHLKQYPSCVYSVVTVAASQYEPYRNLSIALSTIYLEGSILHKTGSALSALLATRLAEHDCGVAPCHAADNFSRKIGRIMAKGRLLKLLRAKKAASPAEVTHDG